MLDNLQMPCCLFHFSSRFLLLFGKTTARVTLQTGYYVSETRWIILLNHRFLLKPMVFIWVTWLSPGGIKKKWYLHLGLFWDIYDTDVIYRPFLGSPDCQSSKPVSTVFSPPSSQTPGWPSTTPPSTPSSCPQGGWMMTTTGGSLDGCTSVLALTWSRAWWGCTWMGSSLAGTPAAGGSSRGGPG